MLIYSILVLPVYAGSLNPLLEASVKYKDIRVARVSSVDRILLEDDVKLTLIGIKGPKLSKPRSVERDKNGFVIEDSDPTTPFDLEALRYARSLVEGKSVRLEFDVQSRDDRGDRLAYVFLPDGRMLNIELVRNGYAEMRLMPPNMKYAEQFRSAYQEARREMRGMQGEW